MQAKTRQRRESTTPFRINFQHPVCPCVIARAGISPMHRIVDIASFNGILVDVFDFLQHHRKILYLLRMRAFFPELIIAVYFMRLFIKANCFRMRSALCSCSTSSKRFAVHDLKLLISAGKSGDWAIKCRWFSKMTKA